MHPTKSHTYARTHAYAYARTHTNVHVVGAGAGAIFANVLILMVWHSGIHMAAKGKNIH